MNNDINLYIEYSSWDNINRLDSISADEEHNINIVNDSIYLQNERISTMHATKVS